MTDKQLALYLSALVDTLAHAVRDAEGKIEAVLDGNNIPRPLVTRHKSFLCLGCTDEKHWESVPDDWNLCKPVWTVINALSDEITRLQS